MSEKMRPIPFASLIGHALSEYAGHGTVFGVGKLYRAGCDSRLPLFGESLETPFGPAAGPNTQLAQNIIAAYVAGSRFFELKTVQTLDGDELAKCISRPCILAEDEGYNCEWSTELTVPQALDEYLKAWWALKLLAHEIGFGSPNGFIFNMSVGYDLAGIKTEKIDRFIETLRNPENSPVWQECRDWALQNLEHFRFVDEDYIRAVKPRVSSSITLSTLHGCPPQEIESIATYLIGEKHLHTFIKCNPTLLGYDFARTTLDALGYDYVAFGDFHFKDDLQYADAVPMFRRLQELAEKNGVSFGVKLTNTFPVDVTRGELPSEEMYMSGRSLFPLTAELARRLTADFNGKLHISYSGGADIHSLRALCEAGIWPVTMATNLLKPGGYNRLRQIAFDTVDKAAHFTGVFGGVDLPKITDIAVNALKDPWYRKPLKPVPSRKMDRKVPLLDCFEAPCRSGCPISQDIPAYVRLLGEGKTLEALRVITERNALPNITGEICPHHCADKCTRSYYEGAVDIRGAKHAAAAAFDQLLAETAPPEPVGRRAAVVGGGPGGLAAAFFLAKSGWEVAVFEKERELGGVVRAAIPDFRVSAEAVDRDISLCAALGVQFHTGHEITGPEQLQGYDAVILAVGAHRPGRLPLDCGKAMDALDFLRACKAGTAPDLGKNIAVVGGGNTAMDTARAAKRLPGVERVSLVYRRTRRWMPADEEELEAALGDGVIFCELLEPVGTRGDKLLCRRMVLGKPDVNGRRAPMATDETEEIPADTVIAAVGERLDSDFYAKFGLKLDEKRRPVLQSETGESSMPGVYLAGDGCRGPATVVEAIADAARAVHAIAGSDFDAFAALNREGSARKARSKKGVVCAGGSACSEAERCLECATVCEICVEVCPNRANLSVTADGRPQIIHVDGMCNECGNCAVFCPYDSAPYKEKFTLYWSAEDLDGDKNDGFLSLGGSRWLVRLDGERCECDLADEDGDLPPDIAALIRAFAAQFPELAAGN